MISDFSRGVAQLGRAPALGAGGRWFKSSHPDHTFHLSERRRTKPMNTKRALKAVRKAIKRGDDAKAFRIIEKHPKVRKWRSRYGTTLYHLAAKHTCPEAIFALHRCGADPLIKDSKHKMPMNYAVAKMADYDNDEHRVLSELAGAICWCAKDSKHAE